MKKRTILAACLISSLMSIPCKAEKVNLFNFEELYVSRLTEYEVETFNSIHGIYGVGGDSLFKVNLGGTTYGVWSVSYGVIFLNMDDLSVEAIDMYLYRFDATDERNDDYIASCVSAYSAFEYAKSISLSDPFGKAIDDFSENFMSKIYVDELKNKGSILYHSGETYDYYASYSVGSSGSDYISFRALAKSSPVSDLVFAN